MRLLQWRAMKNRVAKTMYCGVCHEPLSLLRVLGKHADEACVSLYLVGGVVRDLILERENLDFDLTVEGDGSPLPGWWLTDMGPDWWSLNGLRRRGSRFQTDSRWTSLRPDESPIRTPHFCQRSSLPRSRRISLGGTSRSMPLRYSLTQAVRSYA